MERRAFSKGLLATVSSFALMDSLFAFNAFEKAIKPITDHWAIQLHEFCTDLQTDAITTLQWQEQVETLYKQIELQEILRFISFEKLTKGFQFPDLGVHTKAVHFPRLEGLPENTVFVKKIFGMKKDRAIIPHGHSNMASAHLVLQGEMHLRQYEKIAQEADHLYIKPTIDTTARPGESSSISDEKNNIHWFIANTESAFTFDVIMLDLHNTPYDIHNVDMYEAQQLRNGAIRVPVLDVATALKNYGKHTHY